MNKLKLRTKLEAVLIVAFLLAVGISSVFAVTRTISDTGDTVYTRITCSNGNVYEATAANLQSAINSLNNQSGMIQLPTCDITITTPIKLGEGCHLNGVGNGSILRLGNGANTTVVKNYDQTNGNDFIKISNIRIEGNSNNQDVYYDAWYSYTCGIWLKNCKYAEIYGVTVNNTRNQGILADKCKFIDTHDCMFTNLGSSFIGSGLAHYAAEGIYYFNTTDSIISNIIVTNAFTIGIVTEGYTGASEKYWTKNITVVNCIVTDTGVGYYAEDAKNIIFDACIVSCNTDDSAYGVNAAKGFNIAGDTNRITISNCIIQNTYRGIGLGSGSYHIIDNCRINDTTSYGIEFGGSQSLINNNIIAYTGNNAIVSSGQNNTIIGNHIYHAGQWSAGIALAGSKNQTIIGNHIVGTGTTYPNIGIYGANTCYWNLVVFNQIMGVQLEIYQINATKGNHVNFTGYDDWNMYVGMT